MLIAVAAGKPVWKRSKESNLNRSHAQQGDGRKTQNEPPQDSAAPPLPRARLCPALQENRSALARVAVYARINDA